MNRRDFLVRSSFALSAGLWSRSWLQAQSATRAAPAASWIPEFKPLRRGVGLYTARGGSIGWLVNADALAAVDTQFPETAEAFLAGLPGRGGRTLDVVINTHHHGDHTGGNPVFKPAAKRLVGHDNVPELMRAAAQRAGKPADDLVVPDTTFAETWRATLGDEEVSARYFGPAHTRGDIVVTFEKANVVHLGDLMFNRLYPVIDRPGGARIRGWIAILEKIAAEYPADAIYIFGHGNPAFGVTGQRGDLLVLRDYLSGLLAHVEKGIAAGKAREDIVALENLPGFPDFHVTRNSRLPANLGVAYDELTSSS